MVSLELPLREPPLSPLAELPGSLDDARGGFAGEVEGC